MTLDQTMNLVETWRRQELSIVFTNGCFDIVHLGHIDYLEKARQLGDKLIVGLNADQSIKAIKGSQKPIINEYARSRLLASLQFVDIVILFEELTPIELIKSIRPNVLVKGGDYTFETIVGADFVSENHGTVKVIPSIHDYSTTSIIQNILQIHTKTPTFRNGLIASGSVLVDYIILIKDWPLENCTAFIEQDVHLASGGAPYNIVKNLRSMNASFPLSLVGLIGDDSNGQWILNDCKKSNINTDQLEIIQGKNISTSYTYVMSVENTNRRTFFHQQGANSFLDRTNFDFTKTNAKLFYLGPLTQLKQLDQLNNERTNASIVLEQAILSGLETIVDFISGKNENYSLIAKSSLPFIDHLIINETEAGLIFNRILTSDQLNDIKQIANDLIDLGVRKTVTIHSAEESILITNEKNIFLQGSIILPDNFIISSVGARDAFVSDMIYGFHEQWPLEKTLHLAVCVAAMSLSDESSTNGVRTIEQCLNLQKFGFRTLNF